MIKKFLGKVVMSLWGGGMYMVLKGIFMLRKEKGVDGKRGKKNVVFVVKEKNDEEEESEEDEEGILMKKIGEKYGLGFDGEVGFEDENEVEEEESEEEEDDEVCIVCLKFDFKCGN